MHNLNTLDSSDMSEKVNIREEKKKEIKKILDPRDKEKIGDIVDSYDKEHLDILLLEIEEIKAIKDKLVRNKRKNELISLIKNKQELEELEQVVHYKSFGGKIKNIIDLVKLNKREFEKNTTEKFYRKENKLYAAKYSLGFDPVVADLGDMSPENFILFKEQLEFGMDGGAYDKKTWLEFAEQDRKTAKEYKKYFMEEPYASDVLFAIGHAGGKEAREFVDSNLDKAVEVAKSLYEEAGSTYNDIKDKVSGWRDND